MGRISQLFSNTKEVLLNSEIEFRVRLFNILAMMASVMCMFLVLATYFTGAPSVVVLLCFLSCIFCLAMLIYSHKTKNYNHCYLITIIIVFFIIFPIFFFSDGGYHSGMSTYYVFAIVFTVLMLDRFYAIIVVIFEILLFVGMCVIAYFHPETVTPIETELRIFFDALIAFLGAGTVCGTVVYAYMGEYEKQRVQLSEQNERLQKYNEAKNTFLTTVAHEIKNPLTAISLNARDTLELCEEKEQDKEQIQVNLETVEKIVMRIDRILSDLMDTVSIEQGRLSLSLAPLQLKDVIKEAGQTLAKDARAKNNQIIYNIEDIPPVFGDYQRLLQVMINLISNSIKHTKNGTIVMSLHQDGNYQVVSVSDTGAGMQDKIKNEVFKGYVSISKEYWRHGIGLYVSHQIINSHNGSIALESELGVGTKVEFKIPVSE